MHIFTCESGPLATNTYLAGDESAGIALIIDAPKDCTGTLRRVLKDKYKTVTDILLTHSHWDHTADAAALKELFSLTVHVHKLDEYRMLNPTGEIIPPPFPLEPMTADSYFQHGDEISAGTLRFHVLHTPGHTEGSVCFYEAAQGVLFSGDTLFSESVGRTDLPGGSWSQLMHSIKSSLLSLPDDTVVYPGHGPRTTIGDERMFNPFLNGEIA